MKYESLVPITRADAERAFTEAGGDVTALTTAILGAAQSVDDAAWLRAELSAFTKHASPAVRSAAARGLGHVARLHAGDAASYRAVLEPLLREASTRGAARDALDDVDVFCR